jgi:hypothetical protein
MFQLKKLIINGLTTTVITIIGAQREDGLPIPTSEKLIIEYAEIEEEMNYWPFFKITECIANNLVVRNLHRKFWSETDFGSTKPTILLVLKWNL